VRVLHVADGRLYGGVERILATFAQMGDSAGVDMRYGLGHAGRLSDELEVAGAAPILLGSPRLRWPWSIRRARRRLEDLLETSAYDAVICHSAWPLAVFGPTVRRRVRRLVLWLHDCPSRPGWLDRRARDARPDLVICNSRFTAAGAAAFFKGAAIECLYAPVAPPPPDTGARAAIRRELATPPDARVILHASRFERWKGHRVLLEALAALRDVPGLVLWIVGGPQRRRETAYQVELQALTARLGIGRHVRFCGERRDIDRLMRAADVHCQPNLAPEPFGIVLVEALACGLPVVTTGLGGAAEIVDDSCGVLLPPGDVGALAAALRRLFADEGLRGRLGSAGPARARALCEPRQQTARLAALLGGSPVAAAS
jgi:glycosyltransferase involved in cell wall biosynthesis